MTDGPADPTDPVDPGDLPGPEITADSPRGADLARQALAAARRQNAAKRRGRVPVVRRSGGSTRALRRRRWSGAGPDHRDPQPLGSALQRFVKDVGSGADLAKATVFARWSEIVGPQLAQHCSPTDLVDGELKLQCESTAWASQIRLMAPQLVRRVNEAVGHGSVRRVRASGPAAPSWRFGPRHVAGRGPRDTYG